MTPAERRRLLELHAKANRRRHRLELTGLVPLAWPERLRLAWTGLARLWASRRPWRRLELETARQAERDGRRRLLAAWWGSWGRVGPQRSTLWTSGGQHGPP